MGKPSEEDRVEILKVRMKGMPADPDIRYEEIAKQLEGFSGAQLRLVCTDAAYTAMNDEENHEQTIKQRHFLQVIQSQSR